MAKREQLREQYEDALFAVLMDEWALEEGEKALRENERLKNDPDFVVPLETQQRCMKTISRCCAESSARKVGRGVLRIANKVAIVALLGVVIAAAAFATSEIFREKTINWMKATFDNRIEFRMEDTSGAAVEPDEAGYPVVARWLPDGYRFVSQESDSRSMLNLYENNDREEIKVEMLRGSIPAAGIDEEDVLESRPVVVNGHAAEITIKVNRAQLAWVDREKDIFVSIKGPLDVIEDLTSIAENLVFAET